MTGSISRNTTYLVAGENPGSKLDQAKGFEIPVLNEQQAVKGGDKNIGGEGAPKVTGTSDKERQ